MQVNFLTHLFEPLFFHIVVQIVHQLHRLDILQPLIQLSYLWSQLQELHLVKLLAELGLDFAPNLLLNVVDSLPHLLELLLVLLFQRR